MHDAWRFDANAKVLAANARGIELMSCLYGLRARPFQTLNFLERMARLDGQQHSNKIRSEIQF